MLSRKRLSIYGLNAYLDMTAQLGTAAATGYRQTTMASPSSQVAPLPADEDRYKGNAILPEQYPQPTAGKSGLWEAAEGWEKMMVEMIHAPPGAGHILAAIDLCVGATFDLSGSVLRSRCYKAAPHSYSLHWSC